MNIDQYRREGYTLMQIEQKLADLYASDGIDPNQAAAMAHNQVIAYVLSLWRQDHENES